MHFKNIFICYVGKHNELLKKVCILSHYDMDMEELTL
jgi:hypothetical protein